MEFKHSFSIYVTISDLSNKKLIRWDFLTLSYFEKGQYFIHVYGFMRYNFL